MKRLITLLFQPLLLLIFTYQAHAVQYIQPKALTQALSTTVKPCPSKSPVQVPLITWGGDIPTIFANGNNILTQKDSLFAKKGLNLQLVRQDIFSKQVENYLSCQSPFLRGTMGMIHMAAEVANKDPRTKLVPIYQLTWSAGGDAMVVKQGINTPKDLRGKTIAVQAYGPHVDYLGKILSDAGLTMKDVQIKWVQDLTGTKNTPMAAFYESGVHATMVIIPDGLALTSSGKVGTGAEDSVKGARILLSTKTANRVIADVYAVRSDFLTANREWVQNFVQGLLLGTQETSKIMKNKKGPLYLPMIKAAAKILLDSPQAVNDTQAMYNDAEFVGWKGNVKFFTDARYPRNLNNLSKEIQNSFIPLALLSSPVPLSTAGWDYQKLSVGIADTSGVELPRFDPSKVASVVTQKQQRGTLGEGQLYAFEVFFQPNQNTFTADLYQKAFNRVINLASAYGGAIITVEGHSDPLGYLKQKKNQAPQVLLTRVKQSAKNLSLTRSVSVRNSLINYAKQKGVTLDPSQFAVVGHGINKPKTGMCGIDPCAPKTKEEWLHNMRVEFRLIQVEAEESVFKPL